MALSAIAVLLLPLLAGALLRLRDDPASAQWPARLSLTTGPPSPKRDWKLQAEVPGWPQARSRFRRMHEQRSVNYERLLRNLMSEDNKGNITGQDTFLWKEARKFPREQEVDAADESFWYAVCRPEIVGGANASLGGNASNSSDGSGRAQKLPLDGWTVSANTSCSPKDWLDGDFDNEQAAKNACSSLCASIQDVGCERANFRLCKVGAHDRDSADGTCLRRRMPKQRAPEGKPRPPREVKFWKEFCSRGAVYFRLLFPERRCASGKVLEGAYTEPACAEKASSDPACGDIFDLQEGPPAMCRCVPKGEDCQAAPHLPGVDGAEGVAAVFLLRQPTNKTGSTGNSSNTSDAGGAEPPA